MVMTDILDNAFDEIEKIALKKSGIQLIKILMEQHPEIMKEHEDYMNEQRVLRQEMYRRDVKLRLDRDLDRGRAWMS